MRKDCYPTLQPWNGHSTQNTWASCTLRNWLNRNYKGCFSQEVQSLMGNTSYRYTIGGGDSSVSTRADAIFTPSLTELGLTDRDANTEGTTLPIASTLATATWPGGDRDKWTRSPMLNADNAAMAVSSSGEVSQYYNVVATSLAALPCFTLPATALVDNNLNLMVS